MKIRLIVAIVGLSTRVLAQNFDFTYRERLMPHLPADRMTAAKTLYDLDPTFCRHMQLPYRERNELDQYINRQRMLLSSLKVNYLAPGERMDTPAYLQQDFDRLATIEQTEMQVCVGGKWLSANGKTEKMSPAQLNLLRQADLGSDLRIKILWAYKNPNLNVYEGKTVRKEGQLSVRVVPQVEAEFPGGNQALIRFFRRHVTDKMEANPAFGKAYRAAVRFEVSPQGEVTNARISESSGITVLDGIILSAIRQLPAWKPAETATGQKTKQTFEFQFGRDGC